MKKLNVAALAAIPSTFASLRYCGEVKMTKKAREANETLAKAITDCGGVVAEKGAACPFTSVTKVNQYTVSVGAKLRYKRCVELMTKRNGVETDYHPEHRNLGMFPVFGELIWVKNDLSEAYIRAYQTTKPKAATYLADGKEVPKAILGQWLPVKDFNTLSGIENSVSVVADMDDNIIYCQDEDGNLVLDSNGEPMTMALPEVRAIKVSNCQLFRKGQEIKIFTEDEWDENELIKIRDAYYAKFEENA